jgi:hypothetical protein
MGMLEDSGVAEPPFENGVAAMYPSDADSGRVFFQGVLYSSVFCCIGIWRI